MIYLITVIAALTGFLFGFDEGIMAGVISAVEQEFSLTAQQTGIVMGLLPLGALCSSCITGKLSNKIGRLRVLYLIPIIFSVATLLIIECKSYNNLCIARFLLGISIGLSVVISPVYIAETAPKHLRGKLVTFFQLAITLGILLSYALNLLNVFHLHPISWRGLFAFGLIPSTCLFFGSLFIPESPRWLCTHGKRELAQKALMQVYNKSRTTLTIEQELDDIEHTIVHEKKKHLWKTLLSPSIRPSLSLGMILFLFQQLSGINVIIYFTPIIFNELQLGSTLVTLIATVGVGTVNFLTTFLAMRWIEKMGRRPLLLLGFIGTALTLLCVALIVYLDMPSIRWISAIAIFGYIACFAVSLGPLPWVMMPEIFPLHFRGQGASFATASNWIFNTLVVISFPTFLYLFGIGATFLIYAFFCFLGFLFSWRYVPETKNLSLETIEDHIYSKKPLRELGRSH